VQCPVARSMVARVPLPDSRVHLGLDAIAVRQVEFLRWDLALAGFFDTQDGTENEDVPPKRRNVLNVCNVALIGHSTSRAEAST